MNKVWEYRIVRSKEYYSSDDNSVDGYDEWLSVQEVYYGDDKEPVAQTTDLQIEGKNIPELREQLQMMLWALDKEVVDEIEPEASTMGTIEDRVLRIEIENTELRDRLSKLSDEITKLGTDGHGNNIYESSRDGGIILRKDDGKKRIKENLENLKTGKKSSTEKGL